MGGERLGKYTVVRHLASGGMAEVLLARTDGIEGFARHVVLKRIRPEHAKDKRFITMFLDEARVAASLHHQNVVQVFDIGEASGEYFFAMEYIHGEDLREILSAISRAKTHMPLGHVVALISAAAAGLHYAHEHRGTDKKLGGIVHRDVSPSNILVGYDGAVKVVDFGIAKAASSADMKSGSLKGKVAYMSPEQCKGEPIDRRSDVYALGVVLYELATTSRLFKGDNDRVMMDAIVNGKIPLPRVRRPELPNDLSQIIMRALSGDPARRYQTADELRIALEELAERTGQTVSTSALASYMVKLFGGKVEPWLEDRGPDRSSRPSGKYSWTEVPRDEEAAAAANDVRSGGKRRRDVSLSPPGSEAPSSRDTRTSAKFGWETSPPAPAARPRATGAKVAMFGLPLLAVAGVAGWHFVLREQLASPKRVAPVAAAGAAPAVAPSVAPAPAAAPVPAEPTPAVAPVPAEPTPAVADQGGPPDAAEAPQPAAPPEPAPPTGRKRPAPPVRRPAKQPAPEVVAAPPVELPAPAPVAPPPVVPAPAPVPAVVTPPPPAPAPVEAAPVAQLSNATVEAVASDHAAQLAKCQGDDELHGQLSVTFQIDAAGKVVKSQVSATLKNPKVVACVLHAVQSWQFPKPPAGAAKGVYNQSFQ